MHSDVIDKFNSFYFIGIGGVSMSALAKYLLVLGKRVGGSDVSANEYTDELTALGVETFFANGADEIENYDFVVYTDAINENDLRLKRALELSKPAMSRGPFLYEVSKRFKTVIGVSGCHGKTTCCSMLAHIFAAAGKAFAAHIGGKDLTYSNFYCSGYDYFITEACEYKKNFLYLKPSVAIILNSGADHVECYGSEEALKAAYLEFASGAESTVALYGDLSGLNAVSFGLDKSADYSAVNVRTENGITSFTVCEKGEKYEGFKLKVCGKHNVLNALAAAAAARATGISFDCIKAGLSSFTGVERRFEKLDEIGGVKYYADYAHHPDELRASLKTVRKINGGRLFVVFQPHTYSRTKLLFKQFIAALSPLENLLIYKTFAAREYFDDSGSALTLSQSIKGSRYGDCEEDICDFISSAEKGDTVLFLGAGDIYFIAKRLCASAWHTKKQG